MKIINCPLVFGLSEETGEALGAKAGVQKMTGRDSEVAGWVNTINEHAPRAGIPNVPLRYLSAGFLLGYQLRGYDNILDFRITENEVAASISGTLLALLASEIRGGQTAEDAEQLLQELKELLEDSDD